MKRRLFIDALAAMAMLLTACGTNDGTEIPSVGSLQQLEGDSTRYGLACDGCSDTIVVILCNLESNPDTFNILEAMRQHRVIGRPRVGDELALMVDSADTTVAYSVVNINLLKNTWCYEVVPQLRPRADLTPEQQAEFSTRMPDSVRKRLMQPREYGFQLMSEQMVRPLGITREQRIMKNISPVIYPEVKRYRHWHIFNGRLVLNDTRTDSLGHTKTTISDTADFVMMRPDTLVLRFNDGTLQRYYRKPANQR